MEEGYIELNNLFVYKLSLELCNLGWQVYGGLDWQQKKIIGDQFIRAVDSVAANIAEGYGRFHYLDKNKFYYNARGSLLETKHWNHLLHTRKIITQDQSDKFLKLANQVHYNINQLIKSQYNSKNQ